MKHKIILFFLLSFLSIYISAQTVINSSHSINWDGVQEWSIGSYTKNVIAFEGASYPKENKLPYFNNRISVDPAFLYNVTLDSVTYINLTEAEINLIPSSLELQEHPQISSSIIKERLNNFLDIYVFPFIKKDGRVLKIETFNLKIEKTNAPQKAKTVTIHNYAANSVLASGKFVKIKIATTGIHKLTYESLSSMGIDPANVRIFGYGGNVLDQNFLNSKIDDLPELAIHMEKGGDGIFNAGDYILFYARGINKWAYNSSIGMFTHTINTYSSYGYYFVTSDVGVGKKIETQTIELPASPTVVPVSEFTDYNVYEKEAVSLASSGKVFYGEKFSSPTPADFSFSCPNPVLTSSAKVRIDVAASSTAVSTFNLTLNGGQLKTTQVAAKAISEYYVKAKAASSIFTFVPANNIFTFTLSYNQPTTESIGYLNFIEVNARRYLKMSGSVMQFQNVDSLGMGIYYQYKLSNTNSNIQIWDITDPQNIEKITTEAINDTLTFIASGNELHSYIAIDPTASTAFSTPEIVGDVTNQNLHALSPANLVILTHPNFKEQAETLAQAHRDIDGLTVAVITTEQVYNEFSSGAPDATAYRWVMKMLYDRAIESGNADDIPKHLLLFGRGTFDNRKLLSSSGENLILTYQADNSLDETASYVTDDYFTFLDDNEGTLIPSHLRDISVGRFPTTTTQEATNIVAKTINYMSNTQKGIWKNQLCFLADDGDGALHMTQADTIASIISRRYPAYQVNKIYLDAYLQEITASGEAYPLARKQFHDLLDKGLLLLDYTGHAGPTGWTNEQILTISDVYSLSNKQLPLWIAATCDFLQFDIKSISAGEHVVLNPNGGGIGILSAARPVFASQNFTLNKLVCDSLFKRTNGKHFSIGDAIAKAKNAIGSENNKLSYIYMGDPAVKLNFPTTYSVKTTHINDSLIDGNDTLRAMSVVKISGVIVDENGATVNGFNGKLRAVAYDKAEQVTTLNNHKDGALTYLSRTNILFSGKDTIENGEFSVTFMLPKDIKYNYGKGRLNYYAYDENTDDEAQGYFENFIVGGSDTSVVYETVGPTLNMYLNSEYFVSGDQVNETPVFYANMSDIHGINIVGSGIGHDLLLTIDEDPYQSYNLNSYFETTYSYTEGQVMYQLPTLEDGKHTLTFRVWDLLNNSSSDSLDFEVVTGLAPEIYKIYNYPNPAKTSTRIVIEHDRPETILETKVDIFDLTGRMVWSFSQSNADEIYWDLIGYNGVKVKAGMYLYRVSINTLNSDVYSKTNKLLIK